MPSTRPMQLLARVLAAPHASPAGSPARARRGPRHRRPAALAQLGVVLLWLLGATKAAEAQSQNEPQTGAVVTGAPARVEVGIWITDIHSIDLLDGSFGAEFYFWWISRDLDLEQPLERLQLLNGRDWSVRAYSRRDLGDGREHHSAYFSATFNHAWDLKRYPFDRPRLQLVFETPLTDAELVFEPDLGASSVSEHASVPGFAFSGFNIRAVTERYGSDFGLPEAAASRYSRLIVEVDLARSGGRALTLNLVGLLVANLIALLTYAVHVSHLNIRASMSAAAIFGAVGNMYSLQRLVDPALGALLIDRIALVTFASIIAALVTGIAVDWLHRAHREAQARRLNWISFSLVLASSLTAILSAYFEVRAA